MWEHQPLGFAGDSLLLFSSPCINGSGLDMASSCCGAIESFAFAAALLVLTLCLQLSPPIFLSSFQ